MEDTCMCYNKLLVYDQMWAERKNVGFYVSVFCLTVMKGVYQI